MDDPSSLMSMYIADHSILGSVEQIKNNLHSSVLCTIEACRATVLCSCPVAAVPRLSPVTCVLALGVLRGAVIS